MNKEELFPQDAELALFNIVLNNPDYVYNITDLREEMFSSDRNKIFFRSLKELVKQDLIPEKTLLFEYLSSNNELESVGGKEWIEGLYKYKFKSKNFNEYKRLFIRSFKAKNLLSLSAEIPKLVEGRGINVDAVISNVRNRLDRLSSSSGRGGTFRLSELLPDALKSIDFKIENPGLAGISTGFDSLDNITGGFKGGDLWMLGGRPGMGKTSFACSSILYSAKRGGIPLIFSLEMTSQILIERLLSIESGVDLSGINLGTISKEEHELVKEGEKRIKDLPIYLDSDFLIDVEYIESVVRKFKSQKDINTVWIDYIQLLAERTYEQTHELGRISRNMKLLAKELGVTIILLAQLNRKLESRENKRPLLIDLRQSGNLEEDPDVVSFLYRDVMYNPNTSNPKRMEFLIRKHRNGPLGILNYKFIEERAMVKEERV